MKRASRAMSNKDGGDDDRDHLSGQDRKLTDSDDEPLMKVAKAEKEPAPKKEVEAPSANGAPAKKKKKSSASAPLPAFISLAENPKLKIKKGLPTVGSTTGTSNGGLGRVGVQDNFSHLGEGTASRGKNGTSSDDALPVKNNGSSASATASMDKNKNGSSCASAAASSAAATLGATTGTGGPAAPVVNTSSTPFYERPAYLDRLTPAQRALREVRANFLYRELQFVDAEEADWRLENEVLAYNPSVMAKRAGELSPRTAAQRGIQKITKTSGRAMKQDLVARILCRWWYAFPENVITEAEQRERSRAGLELQGLTELSLSEFWSKFGEHAAGADEASDNSARGGGKAEKAARKLGFSDEDAAKNADGESINGEPTSSAEKGKKEMKKGGKKRSSVASSAKADQDEADGDRTKFVYSLSQFPGVFRNCENELFDFRPQPRICYAFLERKPEAELRRILKKALEAQKMALELKMQNENRWSYPYDRALILDLEGQIRDLRNS
ncbi:unnamed protein product [Amoebophrya sp. A25]|nr:unnamed protein product [Amoebophrya sp. A25]|eukprot:GSA25T00009729001.1